MPSLNRPCTRSPELEHVAALQWLDGAAADRLDESVEFEEAGRQATTLPAELVVISIMSLGSSAEQMLTAAQRPVARRSEQMLTAAQQGPVAKPRRSDRMYSGNLLPLASAPRCGVVWGVLLRWQGELGLFADVEPGLGAGVADEGGGRLLAGRSGEADAVGDAACCV